MDVIQRIEDDPLMCEVTKWAAHYDHRLALTEKEEFHLEAFVARVMFVLKK